MIRWRKVREVSRFELLSAVRSKSWLIWTFGMPVFAGLYGAVVGIPAMLAARQERVVRVYGVVDEASALALSGDVAGASEEVPAEVRAALRAAGHEAALDAGLASRGSHVFRPVPALEDGLRDLREGRLHGVFRVPGDWVETGVVESYSRDVADLAGSEARRAFESLLVERIVRGKVEDALVARVRDPVSETRRLVVDAGGNVKPGGGPLRALRILVPVGFAILLLIAILTSSGGLAEGVGLEKENRVVEILLSSAAADEILAGKLLGLGAVGMIQTGVWFGMAGLAGAAFAASLASLGFEVPFLGLAAAAAFFPLGYLFFGSLMIGSGSLGKSRREAQQWGMAWAFLAVVPLLFLEMLIREPHGTAAHALSWLPFSAPITVVFRATLAPEALSWWEIAGPAFVLAACIWLVLKVAARLFRVGLLLTGVRPTLREIARQARLG